MDLFINRLATDPFEYFAWVLLAMFSICVHEYAHARVALKLGDDTAAWMGHLSLNPLVQMGVPSIVVLLLFGIAWGAVPVNSRNLRGRGADAMVSAAGPLSNLLLCVLFGGLAVAAAFTPWHAIGSFLTLACVANGVLCLFNLLPIPMFDGWSILRLWVPALDRLPPQHAQSVSWAGLMLLWWSPLGDVVWGVGAAMAMAILRGWMAILPLHALAGS